MLANYQEGFGLVHHLIHEAQRQAEKLNRYCIRPHKGCAILWRFDHGSGWRIAAMFPSVPAAEDYLFSQLPAIESEL